MMERIFMASLIGACCGIIIIIIYAGAAGHKARIESCREQGGVWLSDEGGVCIRRDAVIPLYHAPR